jgi:1,4-alpha-glucan branching enzyme
VRDLNRSTAHARAACERLRAEGFEWIEANDAESVYRLGAPWRAGDAAGGRWWCNFTPVERRWRWACPRAGRWREALNTDAAVYGGGQPRQSGRGEAEGRARHGQPQSADVTLPPLVDADLPAGS